MARYINADALLSKMPDDLPYKSSVKRVLMQATATDVAPKGEVDYARQCGYESGIRTGARKVFDAVDELIKDYAHNHLDPAELVVRLYLLKKKYTEGTKNE